MTEQVSHTDRNLTCGCNVDDQNVKPGMYFLMFVMKIYIFIDLFGNKVEQQDTYCT